MVAMNAAANSYTATEMMTVVAARALSNDDVVFVGIGAPSAACNLARLTHAPDITLIYEFRHDRHAAERLAAVDWRRRARGHGAHHRRGPRNVPLLAAGRAHHRRLFGRCADRPLRQSQHHRRRRLSKTQSAAAGRRRRARDRHALRADFHHHGDGETRLCGKASIHHLARSRRRVQRAAKRLA